MFIEVISKRLRVYKYTSKALIIIIIIIIIIITIIRQEIDLLCFRSSLRVPAKVFQVFVNHLVYNSALFASYCCSFKSANVNLIVSHYRYSSNFIVDAILIKKYVFYFILLSIYYLNGLHYLQYFSLKNNKLRQFNKPLYCPTI